MADDRRIVIELKIPEEQTDGTAATGGVKDQQVDLTKSLKSAEKPTNVLDNAMLGKSILIQQVINQARTQIKSYAGYAIGKYYNLTENYKMEQAIENVQSVMSHAMSGGFAIAGGVAAAGPIGGLVAGTGWLLGEILNAIKAWDRQHMELTAMNMQSSFQQVRLGLIDNGRGTLN